MLPEFSLTAFADEIDPSIGVQIETLVRLGLTGIDVRSVDGVNVLELSEAVLSDVYLRAKDAGLRVQCVASPVNKVPYTPEGQAVELERLKRAISAAQGLGTERIRLFSPEFHELDPSPVLDWMGGQVELAKAAGVVLVHENDAKYFGAYPDGARILLEAFTGPNFCFAFDFANTVQIGLSRDDWFPWILPYLDTIHIKDARAIDGQVVVAGEGDGKIEDTVRWLIDKGWRGTFSMEPHLQAAGRFGGFSGVGLFEAAVDAFKSVLARAGGRIGT